MKRFVKYIFLLVALGIAAFFIWVKLFSVKAGQVAPDFKTELVDGTQFQLSELNGNYVLLDFWGSWCPPCRKENPELVRLHEKYSETLKIVTVALEKGSGRWQKVAEADGFMWKHQIVDKNKLVLMSSIAQKYGVTEIPAKFLISPDGVLIGELTFKQVDSVMASIMLK